MGPSIFEEWNKNIVSFVDYILFTLDEGFYCWIADGGVKNGELIFWFSSLLFCRLVTEF